MAQNRLAFNKMKNLLHTIFLLSLFAFAQGVWAQTFITDVMVIAGDQSQTNGYKTQFQNQGWAVINNDLNAGAGGKFIYLLYKTDESPGSNYATRGEQAKREPAYLCIEAGKDGSYDRTYVQFGGGNTLCKMRLSDNTPSVSVWHEGKDWAAVTIETATGELPVNFKAAEDGTYTIIVGANGLNVDYLHLIDNLTGADVNLLVPEPVEGPASYTFTAKTTDYASRFKLVFSTQVPEPVEGTNQPFAYISNGEIIVNGERMLQVIDMMGRVIVS